MTPITGNNGTEIQMEKPTWQIGQCVKSIQNNLTKPSRYLKQNLNNAVKVIWLISDSSSLPLLQSDEARVLRTSFSIFISPHLYIECPYYFCLLINICMQYPNRWKVPRGQRAYLCYLWMTKYKGTPLTTPYHLALSNRYKYEYILYWLSSINIL